MGSEKRTVKKATAMILTVSVITLKKMKRRWYLRRRNLRK